jgi:hypothetical protein
VTAPYPDAAVRYAIDTHAQGGLSYPAIADLVWVRWPDLKRPSWRTVQAWCAGENQKRRRRARRAEELKRQAEEERGRAAEAQQVLDWLSRFELGGADLTECRLAVPAGLRDYKVLQPKRSAT